MIFVFSDCELDLDRFELRRAGRLRPVEPQVFDLLAVLIRERHRVVPKEELLDTVWGNRFVSESALTSRVKAARQAIGDNGRNQRLIRTAHGRGYQFTAAVDEAAQPDPVATVASAPPEQEIRFSTAGDGTRLAYAVSGAGPPLVKAANWLSHLAYDWESPVWRHWLAELSRRSAWSGTTSEAAGCRIGTSGGSRSRTGWTTWRLSSTPPGWTGSRCWASHRVDLSPSPKRYATPDASPTWCCSADRWNNIFRYARLDCSSASWIERRNRRSLAGGNQDHPHGVAHRGKWPEAGQFADLAGHSDAEERSLTRAALAGIEGAQTGRIRSAGAAEVAMSGYQTQLPELVWVLSRGKHRSAGPGGIFHGAGVIAGRGAVE